eukprot:CAMPEP_0119405072 /NCGR_PEP_ID=MMETSP1334-20130426/144214_1 /TAXON_ID=127549 /ORGANISM="Calcidiscus leptoporus, Strain RCC1130" /LENGTH=104 /DNA_ID=CAMNT_0007429043 /DNA_START=611 /DNA_END=926 /DNA_ORIENTATION=+
MGRAAHAPVCLASSARRAAETASERVKTGSGASSAVAFASTAGESVTSTTERKPNCRASSLTAGTKAESGYTCAVDQKDDKKRKRSRRAHARLALGAAARVASL